MLMDWLTGKPVNEPCCRTIVLMASCDSQISPYASTELLLQSMNILRAPEATRIDSGMSGLMVFAHFEAHRQQLLIERGMTDCPAC